MIQPCPLPQDPTPRTAGGTRLHTRLPGNALLHTRLPCIRPALMSLLAIFTLWAGTSAELAAQQPDLGAVASSLEWREIGPAVMGGRITDLAVNEHNPSHFFVGTATGGLWKTTSNGQDWEPVFDDQPTSSIGAVSLAPSNPNIIWVGTGEPQNRQSSPYGAGVFRSADGGSTWKALGLEETRHIGAIVVHPTNPDVAWVAAVGHLWGPNPERGVYRTMDAGATWEKVLFIDDNTGAIDLVMDPSDPNTLFAAMYQRRRTAMGFSASGTGSGLHRTLDGGNTWTDVNEGLPKGDKGRIGLDVYRRDGNLVYAIVESSDAGRGIYRSDDRGENWTRMSGTNPRPMYFSLIRIDPNDPERIYIGGVQFGMSNDGGRTFKDGDAAEGIHVDHHALWIDPANSDHLLLGSDGGLSTSWDRAQNWRHINNLALGQFYEIGVSMEEPYTVCGGLQDNSSWCAPHNTLSSYGITNGDWEDVSGGDGFYNKIDPTDPNIIFTESQGGNVVRHDRRTGEGMRVRPVPRPTAEDEDRDYRFNWNSPIHISSHDPTTIFIGANHLLRSRDRGMSWEEASPDLTRQIDRDTVPIMGALVTDSTLSRNDGQSNYGNISSISESPLNPDLIYVGTDDGLVQRTRDGGSTWTAITPREEDVPELTYVSSVVASSAVEGRVYATFDGHFSDDYAPYALVSDDHGDSWRAITNGLPDESVNRIREHPRTSNLLFLGNEIGAYFSVNGGADWNRLDGNLPTVPVDDIVIHPRDNDLILGTHGRSIWIMDDITPLENLASATMANAHVFPVRDVHMMAERGGWPFWGDIFQGENPPEGALLRYWVGEGAAIMAAQDDAAENGDTGHDDDDNEDDNGEDGNGDNGNDNRVTGDADHDNEDASARVADDDAKLIIRDSAGQVVRTLEAEAESGLHEATWDLRTKPPYEAEEDAQSGGRFGGPPRGPMVLPGTYTVQLSVGGSESTTSVNVLPDPRVPFSQADRAARQVALDRLNELAEPVYQAGQRVRDLKTQVSDIQKLIKNREGLPESLTTEVEELATELDSIQADLGPVARGVRLGGAIEGSSTLPTVDQTWQIEQAEEDAAEVIVRINSIIEDRMPALNRQLDELGVRPDPGTPISVPRRSSGG